MNVQSRIQGPISPNLNSCGNITIERKSALAKFWESIRQPSFAQHNANEGSVCNINTNEGRLFRFWESVSCKSYNLDAEQDSQTSSMINGFTRKELNKVWPSINHNFECESKSGYGLLPEGIGGLSDNSKLIFNTINKMISEKNLIHFI